MQTILISNNLSDTVTSHLLLPTSVSIRARFPSPQTAFAMIQQLRPELLLLDLEWLCRGGESSIQSLKTYCKEIVFLSTSSKYGLRVVSAGGRTQLEQINLPDLNNLRLSTSARPYKLGLPTTDGWTFVEIQNILQVQARAKQTYFYCCDGTDYLISRPFAVFVPILSTYSFGQVDSTLLVNLALVKVAYQAQQLILSWENKRDWAILPDFQADIEERLRLMAWMAKPITPTGCQ
jgi:DNA-binding LytR/AlgR family response regulator